MSDQALQNAHRLRDEALIRLDRAKADLAQAQEAIAVAKADLEKVNGFITLWHSFADYDRALSERAESRVQESPPAASGPDLKREVVPEPRRGKRPRGNPKKELVAGVAREIIQERSAPMMRSELFEALRERGLEIKGADPEMVLSTMLWRVPTAVVRLPDFGYWLTEVPFEPAGYDPAATSRHVDVETLHMAVANSLGQLPVTDDGEDEGDADDGEEPDRQQIEPEGADGDLGKAFG